MLAQAEAKCLYRKRIVAGLLGTLPDADVIYHGFVSAGTFTLGYVGAECLPELLRTAEPGAPFCCGTRSAVYDVMRVGSALAIAAAYRQIRPPHFQEIAIIDADNDHAGNVALVVVFRTIEGT